MTGRARDHYASRSGPIGPDGLSRLRLGSAVAGEVEKGVTDYDQIAANIAALYDPAWLERELGRHYRSRYMTRMVDRIAGCLEGRSEVAA